MKTCRSVVALFSSHQVVEELVIGNVVIVVLEHMALLLGGGVVLRGVLRGGAIVGGIGFGLRAIGGGDRGGVREGSLAEAEHVCETKLTDPVPI